VQAAPAEVELDAIDRLILSIALGADGYRRVPACRRKRAQRLAAAGFGAYDPRTFAFTLSTEGVERTRAMVRALVTAQQGRAP
jgi:hypothetical protein